MMAARKMLSIMPSSQPLNGVPRRFQTTGITSTTTTTAIGGSGSAVGSSAVAADCDTVTTTSTATTTTSATPPVASTAMSRALERAAKKAALDAKHEEMRQYARLEMGRYRPPNEAVLALKRQKRSRLNQDLRVQLMVGALLVGLIVFTPALGRYLALTTKRPARSQVVFVGSADDDDDNETSVASSTSSRGEDGASGGSGVGLTFGQVLLAAQHDLHEKAKRGELSTERMQEMRSYLPDSFDEFMPESKHKTMSNDVYTKWRPRNQVNANAIGDDDDNKKNENSRS